MEYETSDISVQNHSCQKTCKSYCILRDSAQLKNVILVSKAPSVPNTKDTDDFKQHLNTTGSPYFPYHTSLDIKSLYTFCGMIISLTTIRRQTHIFNPNMSASAIQSLILFYFDNFYFEFNENFYSQDTAGTMGSPLVELAEISRTLPSPPAQVLTRLTDTLLTSGLENYVINLTHMYSSTSKANQLTFYNI